MIKIPTSENKLLELSFKDECLKTLQGFAYPSNTEDRGQVAKDLKRIYGLKIKNELGEWSYIKENNDFDTKAQSETEMGPDPDEVFLYRIEKLNKKFKKLLLQNFHQGGMFYTARQFLTFHLNSLGFTPNVNQGQKHYIGCEFYANKVIITENFSIEKLGFFPINSLYKVITQAGEWFCSDLEQSEQEKIAYFQDYINTKLHDKINYPKAGLRRLDQKDAISLVFDAGQGKNLIEFTVKHTITLDPKAKEINIKKLSEEDVKFKVQPQLFDLSAKASKPEFANFLSPDLSCVPSGFFERPKFTQKIYNFILSHYRDFLLIILNILYNLVFTPIPIPTKVPFFAPPTVLKDSPNNFPYRMRP